MRHWGDARLIMIDSRAGRVLEEQHRRMLDEDEFAWVEAAMRRAVDEGVEHLILGTSLPWLLPHAIHNLERWNETLNVRHHGRWRGRLAEKVRQAADLEHWAAFGHSFERLGAALTAVARGEHGRAPATALVLSGDVHHAYAAELVRPGDLDAPGAPADRLPAAQPGAAPHPGRLQDRLEPGGAPVHRAPGAAGQGRADELEWEKQAGPFFGNQIGELVLDGREARFLLSVTEIGDDPLRQVLDSPLSGRLRGWGGDRRPSASAPPPGPTSRPSRCGWSPSTPTTGWARTTGTTCRGWPGCWPRRTPTSSACRRSTASSASAARTSTRRCCSPARWTCSWRGARPSTSRARATGRAGSTATRCCPGCRS